MYFETYKTKKHKHITILLLKFSNLHIL